MTRRKATNGEGPIRKIYDPVTKEFKGYQCQLTVKDRYGISRRPSKTSMDLKVVQAWRSQKLREQAAGRTTGTREKPLTVPQVVEMWLEATGPDKTDNTMRNYESTVKNHIKPRFNIRVSSVKPTVVRKLLKDMQADIKGVGASDGRATAWTVLNMLKASLRWAASEDGHYIIDHYPLEGAKFDIGKKRSRAQMPEVDLAKLFAATTGTPSGVMWRLLRATGLRRAEILGLNVGDVHLELRRITVEKIASPMTEGKSLVYRTKAGEGEGRWVPVTDTALLEELAILIKDRGRNEPLFVGPKGGRLAFACYRKWWERDLRKAGLSSYTGHQLRHSFASEMLGVAPLNVVSEILGHASPTTTLGLYAHATDKQKYAAMEALTAASAPPVANEIANEPKTQPSPPEDEQAA